MASRSLFLIGVSAFVLSWIILWLSTFGMHLKLDHTQGWPDTHAAPTPDQHARAALQERVAALEKQISAAESTFEKILVEAVQQRQQREPAIASASAAAAAAAVIAPPPLPPPPLPPPPAAAAAAAFRRCCR